MSAASNGHALITGGAGFVGSNLASRLLDEGHAVTIYDSLSRPGSERNLRWLRARYGEKLRVRIADTRDVQTLREAVSGASQVFHFAAQVAVTSSLLDPMLDFDINLRGTLNVLEAIRTQRRPPPLVFTSTNKVYGALPDVRLRRESTRYEPENAELREYGISEARPLDFHSPYGCSKGGAEQYVLDYARSFGIPAVVLRMSCIYGPRQFGNEDQGWVAHFLIRALQGDAITLYGDGAQVRDILFVEDLVEAMLLTQLGMSELRGRAFNIGGGTHNAISLLELLQRMGALMDETPRVTHAPWRVGDQRWYVSDTRAFERATGWQPRVGIDQGLRELHAWLHALHAEEEHVTAGAHAA
ncbi:MAG TPA: GDP-mannose 4,6-dehydratase [Rhodanobacteraceae bacterium]|nr:GDP-mannose 4,6-dehydratase [Rhodanobacteraceae bacterium]